MKVKLVFMQKGLLQKIYLAGTAALMLLTSCNKEADFDNGTAIRTPYSLYAGSEDGMIIHSTDGESFKFVFPSDGYGPTQIAASGQNLLIIKDNLHLSTNDGQSFNPVLRTLRKFNWQSMIYNHAPFNQIYVTTSEGKGVKVSKDNGLTWENDIFNPALPSLFQVSSFAGLENGKAFAYSNVSNITFVKSQADVQWEPVTTITFNPTLGSEYYLFSAYNSLYMADYNGKGGVWVSTDEAVTWTKLLNNMTLPSDVKYTGAVAPYGNKVTVIATEKDGIYRSDEEGVFKKTTGLPTGTEVRSLAKKVNIYKNNSVKVYIYAATDKGIYRSEDGGKSWFISGESAWNESYTAIN